MSIFKNCVNCHCRLSNTMWFKNDKQEYVCVECFKPRIETKSVRQEILETALGLTCGDRNKTYGPPKANLTCFAELVTAYLHGTRKEDFTNCLDAIDGSIIMALAKISRIAVNKQHKDNYIDGAAYIAIAGECAE